MEQVVAAPNRQHSTVYRESKGLELLLVPKYTVKTGVLALTQELCDSLPRNACGMACGRAPYFDSRLVSPTCRPDPARVPRVLAQGSSPAIADSRLHVGTRSYSVRQCVCGLTLIAKARKRQGPSFGADSHAAALEKGQGSSEAAGRARVPSLCCSCNSRRVAKELELATAGRALFLALVISVIVTRRPAYRPRVSLELAWSSSFRGAYVPLFSHQIPPSYA